MSSASRKTSVSSSSTRTSPAAEESGQLLNKDGSQRKSRVLRRKTDHSIIERRRREKINEKLVALQNLVPACRKECQDLIERKVTPPSRIEAGENTITSKRNVKRKREAEKLEKAKAEMNDKIRSSMVLEKLCIISHTLDFVMRLQEENKALRALCDCSSERRPSINSDVELADHYQRVHSYGIDSTDSLSQDEAGSRNGVDRPSISSEPGTDPEAEQEAPPAKRRLHWGSDDVRQASAHHSVCRYRCDQEAHHEQCQREHSPSLTPTVVDTPGDVAQEAKPCAHTTTRNFCPLPVPCASVQSTAACRTRHSCCREEASDNSSDTSEELTSPPPSDPVHRYSFPRQRLPPIVNLGLPKQDAHLPSLRQDTFASLYRRDAPRPSEAYTPKGFRPLSLYTSHVSRQPLTRVKPQ